MKKIMVGLALGLVAACGKGDKLDGHIAKLDGFRAKMCECKTLECADAVKQEEKAWEKGLEEELKSTYKNRSDVPKSFVEKWEATEKPMKKCYRDLADKAPAPATP